ncbi:MAG: gliding motility lipoprotein GldH [Bacteroidales bacterium]|nr:gliding motility lipoprotein GldH [Bacteroidales bacterium]
MTRATLTAIAAAFCILTACNSNVYYSEHENVDENGWNMNDTKYFDVDVDDVAHMFNFYVDIRNTQDYPYSNAFLFIKTTFPDGGIALDTMECPLADHDGRWYGKSSGRYIDNRYFLRKGVVFPSKGKYTFAITQATRDTNLSGVKDVGIVIEYAVH